ncbi:MAG: ribonuclease HII [Firmicutes bacterium]|nr:ribonuclease HII [Bacillota bacterium]
MKSIAEIKEFLNNISVADIPGQIEQFARDERKGVESAVKSAMKRYENYINEQKRIDSILVYERECYEMGFVHVAGVDEVGRGPLAGPVVTCAVILKKGERIEGVNDSKKLSKAKREELYDIITERALDFSVAAVSPEEIDNINILKATHKAMSASVKGLKVKPDFVLVDALTIEGIDMKQRGIIKGDEKSLSIAAASIVAKVTRDRIMEEYDKIYPQYGFARNAGYGSPEHIAAIKRYGILPIHRRTFLKKILMEGESGQM